MQGAKAAHPAVAALPQPVAGVAGKCAADQDAAHHGQVEQRVAAAAAGSDHLRNAPESCGMLMLACYVGTRTQAFTIA